MAAVYEWRITDLGNGQFGCIWISENGKDEFGEMYRVWVDPTNLDAVATAVFKYDANSLFNLECPEDDAWYSRILFYWKRMGSPVSTARPLAMRHLGSHGQKLDSRMMSETVASSLLRPRRIRQRMQRSSMSKERIYELLDEINAIHEAGHAVVTILVGVSLGCVELVHPSQDVGDEFGRCYRGITTDSETEVLIKFAGVGAELIHRNKGEKWSSPFASSGRGDWQAAKPYLDANGTIAGRQSKCKV